MFPDHELMRVTIKESISNFILRTLSSGPLQEKPISQSKVELNFNLLLSFSFSLYEHFFIF